MTARLTSPALAVALTLSAFAFAQALPPAKEGALPSLAPLVDSVKGAVVNVDVQKKAVNDAQAEMLDRFFRGHRGGGDDEVNTGTGSGFIIDARGLIITNNHVVDGAMRLKVRLGDGRSFDAEIVGRDPLTDVAVVRIKGKPEALPTVRLGDSSQVRVGDWAVAIGNPFGLSQTVSAGIISALDRQIGVGRYDQFLQTDAAINPGNSGGPLFNLKGEVIGMNTLIISSATGIGFAVPSNLIKALVPQLEEKGAVVRGWLGVAYQNLDPTLAKALGLPGDEGALVTQVNEGSPAAKGGMRVEDVILAIDGEKIRNGNELGRVVALKKPESAITITVLRGGKNVDLKVKVGVRPDLEELGNLAPEKPSPERGRVGIAFDNIDPAMAEQAGLPRQGAVVLEVVPGSPADDAGLRRGMLIVELNRQPIRSRDELTRALKAAKSGSVVLLRVARPGGNGTMLAGLQLP